MNMQNYQPKAKLALAMATLAFAANFSVWILYAVIGLQLQETMALSATELGLFFASPMLTGALLRIPAGLAADAGNARRLWLWQMALLIPPLLLLPYATELWHYMVIGLWLGISGTSFTFGVRYVTDWFERNQQGTALGIFGAGNAGAAITLALAPLLVDAFGWASLGWFYALGMIFMLILFALFAPQHQSNLRPASTGSWKAQLRYFKQLQVWRFGLYYYFVFGSYLALILWLPQYYANAYGMSDGAAMAFTLFFATSSSMVRALGGWFADRYGGRAVNWNVFWLCLVCLFFLSYPPTTMTIHGVNQDVNLSIEINVWFFTWLIFVIGIAQGFGRASVYKIINDYYPNAMGSVGGFVAALGALGGCTLPIVFGVAVDLVGIYSVCFMVLYAVLALCMIVMFFANKADRFQQRLQQAQTSNFLEQD
ncbi:MFS transporter [Simiduia curdlanivorans]|uniref:Nitrate/nitrite transporter n=1 Tax=Simiduia curdlanivorans TaxID=1492769 RepID=A0ABV8V5H8_9GAMM|nr:MFS transporter [Simiduia curdlanivorans]MDN3640629.1 MFS transporter [Simiduia curdlanivorans]